MCNKNKKKKKKKKKTEEGSTMAGADPGFQKGGVDGRPYLLTRHLGNYPQDPGNEVAIKPEHRLSTWVGKREHFPTNFAIMSQSESYFASLALSNGFLANFCAKSGGRRRNVA